MIVPALVAKPRRGYARGQMGVEQILRRTERLLIEEGVEALTMRRIALECGMQPGNLAYYFKSKSGLVLATIDAITTSYRVAAQSIVLDSNLSAEGQFRSLIEYYLDNIATRRTTRIFTALWAIASRDNGIAAKLKEVYDTGLTVFMPVVRRLNPDLDDADCRTLSLFIIASLEGQTAFTGWQMPYRSSKHMLRAIAADNFVSLVKNTTPSIMRNYVIDVE